ncbi:MAG: response regulator [Deltaproteobacteria bacterium]|nr:response regulator [Deltaproteobacteria bacterium]
MTQTILVVDDEMHMRFFLNTLFKTSGYEVMVAKEGRDALVKARNKKPDLVILDLMMHGEGGIPTYRQLKLDEQLRDIPVIILSGVNSQAFAHSLKMLSLGLDHPLPEPEAFIEKPPDPRELLQRVQNLLAGPINH